MSAIMIATLGGQPQIITFALDALLKQGAPISHVVVIYLNSHHPRFQQATSRLRQELQGEQYRDRGITYEFVALKIGNRYLGDIRTEAEVDASSRFINDLIDSYKSKRQTLHVCVSGGRRILGLLTMATAILSFQHQDKLWHMFTHDDIQTEAQGGNIMHLPTGFTAADFQLIEVPVLPLGHYFANLRNFSGVAGQRKALDQVEQERCQKVIDQLTEREQGILKALVEGLTRKQVADTLSLSIKTVDQYKTTVYEACRIAWAVPESQPLNQSFVITKFRDFFQMNV